MRLFDSHSHLDAQEFDADRGAVLLRAREAGVVEQLIPAVSRSGFEALRELCRSNEGLYPAYGLHPMYLDEHQDTDLAVLREWIIAEQPRAIGECGLDFFVEGLDADKQRRIFRFHCELAREFQLPLVLHARRAVEEVTQTLKAHAAPPSIVHSFSGSEEQARQLFSMGHCIGIGGPITYERAQRLRRIVQGMPLEFLVMETDAPDQPDASHRGLRNEPSRLPNVLHTLATLRAEPIEAIAEASRANVRRLLRL